MKAIALDDERPALDVIDAFCSRLDSVQLLKTFTRTGEARLFLEAHPVDLLFLDINMPTENGLDFFRSISQRTLVIFTTAYSEYAVQSYDLQAVDYLLKPFTFGRFQQAISRAEAQLSAISRLGNGSPGSSESTHLYFRVDYGLVKVVLADILFVEGLDNYLKIHQREGQPVVVRLTMKAMQDKLSQANFIRVHRSYIVALDKIQAVRHKMILIGDEEIPIGSSYDKDFFGRFAR